MVKKFAARPRPWAWTFGSVEKSRLDEMAGGKNHQGVVAYVTNFTYSALEDMFRLAGGAGGRSPHHPSGQHPRPSQSRRYYSLGGGYGAHGVVIPKNRSAEVNGTVYKTSAEPKTKASSPRDEYESNQSKNSRKNVWVYGADAEREVSYDADLTGPVAVVVGNEGKGIAKKTKEHVDALLSIPMPGNSNP